MVLGSPVLTSDDTASNASAVTNSPAIGKLVLIAGSVLVSALFVGGVLAYVSLSG